MQSVTRADCLQCCQTVSAVVAQVCLAPAGQPACVRAVRLLIVVHAVRLLIVSDVVAAADLCHQSTPRDGPRLTVWTVQSVTLHCPLALHAQLADTDSLVGVGS